MPAHAHLLAQLRSLATASWVTESPRCSRRPASACLLIGRSDSSLATARSRIRASLDDFVGHGILTEQAAAAALDRITTITALASAAAAELVIEAVTEDLPLKRALFAELDTLCADSVVLASSSGAAAERAYRPGCPAAAGDRDTFLVSAAAYSAGRGLWRRHDVSVFRSLQPDLDRSPEPPEKIAPLLAPPRPFAVAFTTGRAATIRRCCERSPRSCSAGWPSTGSGRSKAVMRRPAARLAAASRWRRIGGMRRRGHHRRRRHCRHGSTWRSSGPASPALTRRCIWRAAGASCGAGTRRAGHRCVVAQCRLCWTHLQTLVRQPAASARAGIRG